MVKGRRNAAPLVVERKHRRSLVASAPPPSAPPRATPDRKIRAWNADDREARDAEAFNRKSRAEQYRELIAAWVARHRMANDPEVWEWLAEQQVARHIAEHSMSHQQIIEGPDPRIVVRPKAGLWGDLKHAFSTQYGRTKTVITDPKAPAKMGWWNYFKDLRQRTGER